MTEYYDKFTVQQVLMKPTKLFGFPKIKDKIEAINWLKVKAELSDIEYIYPIVFDNNYELSYAAADAVTSVMNKVKGKCWNRVYDYVKYVRINGETLVKLLSFTEDISAHLVGIATLNSNGYVRERSLKLISGINSSMVVPYVLLRLNDWVKPVRDLAEYILQNTLTYENFDVFIENSHLINKLQNVLRVDLSKVREKINMYLMNDTFIVKVKSMLKHPDIKTRIFCYTLLRDRIILEKDIVDFALKDKSYEVRIWLANAITIIEPELRYVIIEKLLNDKSAKVKVTVLRKYEDIICLKFKGKLESFLYDEHLSLRDEARFITKKHSFITDFSDFYRKQIINTPIPGAIMGLGEIGDKNDYIIVKQFIAHEQPKIKLAAMQAMWNLSKEDTVTFVLEFLNSDIPKIKKIAKRILKDSKMPVVFFEMRKTLTSSDIELKLFALDVIYSYGSWPALDSILTVISNEQHTIIIDRAKELLEIWLNKSSSIYSTPDSQTANNIINNFKIAQYKGLLTTKVLRELDFLFKTRIFK